MMDVVIYSTAYCPYCKRAKELLDKKGIRYTDIPIDVNPEKRDEMIDKTGRYTVPQLIINGQAVGGCDDMYALEQQGRLDELLRG